MILKGYNQSGWINAQFVAQHPFVFIEVLRLISRKRT